jgi:hypothetical protein
VKINVGTWGREVGAGRVGSLVPDGLDEPASSELKAGIVGGEVIRVSGQVRWHLDWCLEVKQLGEISHDKCPAAGQFSCDVICRCEGNVRSRSDLRDISGVIK